MARVLLEFNRKLESELRGLGRSTSPEMIAMAKALKTRVRKKIGPRSKDPSKPGEPPKSKTGKLRKSVVSGAVGAAQRVGLTEFYAPLLEFGVDTVRDDRDAATGSLHRFADTRAGRLLGLSADHLRGGALRSRKARIRRRERTGRHQLLEPRPFLAAAVAEAEQDMVDVYVSAVRRRMPSS